MDKTTTGVLFQDISLEQTAKIPAIVRPVETRQSIGNFSYDPDATIKVKAVKPQLISPKRLFR